MPMIVTFRLRPLAFALAICIVFLTVVHVFVMFCYVKGSCGAGTWFAMNMGYMFDLNREWNIPTWFSVVQLFFVAVLLSVVALSEQAKRSPAGYWWGLTVLFLYLSLDEATDMHGLWTNVVPDLKTGSTMDGFLWVIPATFVVAAVGLIFLRWTLRLPGRTRAFFFASGFIYVTGGLGFGVIGSKLADETFTNPAYLVASTIEEALEMTGVFVMLLGVSGYLRSSKVVLVFQDHGSKTTG